MTLPILPPAALGIIGGGQLGMMAIREAQRMGYRSVVWDPDPACPASRLADVVITAPFDDASAADRLANSVAALTYEFEHIDAALVRMLEGRRRLRPGHEILEIAQHRVAEKNALSGLGIPVARYAVATTSDEVRSGIERVGLPVVVKTASAGYDGKGQSLLRDERDVVRFLRTFDQAPEEVVIEEFLDLACEVSVIAVRDDRGVVREFPVAWNEHRDHILHLTLVPAPVDARVERDALDLARRVVEGLNVVGVLCVEMFVGRDGRVLVNELAPRPHNSGHVSLDACSISQFEALIRVVAGLDVPEPRLLSPCAMVNVLGKHLERMDQTALHRVPGAKVHLYGKTRVEARRKMGHITVTAENASLVRARAADVQRIIGEPVTDWKE